MPPCYSKYEPWLCFLLPDRLGLFSLNNHINYQKHLAQPTPQKLGQDNAQLNYSSTTGQKTALAASSFHSMRTNDGRSVLDWNCMPSSTEIFIWLAAKYHNQEPKNIHSCWPKNSPSRLCIEEIILRVDKDLSIPVFITKLFLWLSN